MDLNETEVRPFVKRKFTTGPGNVAGTTLVDATLVEAAGFWNDCWLLLRTGTYAGELRRVTASVPGTLTLDHTVGGLIAAGVQYVMLPTIPVTVVAGGGLKADLQQVLGQGADIAPGNPLITEDLGTHTNPERWLQDNHWDSGLELVLNAAAAVNLGVAVAAGAARRVRSITVRNTALVNTVITVSQLVVGAGNRFSFDVAAQSTRVWSEQDGILVPATGQVQISSSAAAAGAESYIHAAGVEAAV